jgi:DNA-binding transcriptional MerR regulator
VVSLEAVTNPAIPNRSVFRAQDVCEIADVQPYVLHSWEEEFPDLGVAKTAGGPRVYRRADVERVLRLKHLLFVDGLTLAGAKRRMGQEGLGPVEDSIADADVAALLDEETRRSLRDVRRGLQWILGVLDGEGVTPEDRILIADVPPVKARPKAAKARVSARKSGRSAGKRPASGRSAARKRKRS